MPSDLAAYLLLAMAVLAVGTVLSLPVLLLWFVVGRPRPLPGAEQPVGSERVLRRCDDCGVLWKGRPGQDASRLTMRLRRRVRRRTRERKADTPTWASRRGWSRCPSCLSTNVRTSSASRS